VDVEDTGCGLTIEEKELLFKRFAQASPRTHIQYGGSGLGLFISRQLAILHGGQIGVISVAGKGSTFGFFMQCKRIDNDNIRSATSNQNLEQAQKRENAEEEMIELGASASGPEPKKTRPKIPEHIGPEKTRPKIPELVEPEKRYILLVEDNIVNQRLLSRQLTKAGCIVSTADNGVFALEHLRTTQFYRSTPNGTPLSVILMDWEMPVMNGLTCCKRIREMEWNGELISHVPIIGVTANVRAEQIADAKESGMDDVVSKPFRIPELLARIEVVLQRLKRC
jgi:CheY-like chemotaxis protein